MASVTNKECILSMAKGPLKRHKAYKGWCIVCRDGEISLLDVLPSFAHNPIMLSSPSQAAPDNLIDEVDRTTCDDDPPSNASSHLVPGPQRTLVRIAIDRGESFFKARRPKQIDTFLLNTVVARERHARRGVKRADPFLFLEASAPHTPAPRRRRRSSTATRSWP